MSEREMYRPSGPLDPVAEQIAGFFGADPVWAGLKDRPMAETRAAMKAMMPVTEKAPVEHVEDFRVPADGGEIGLRLYRPSAAVPAMIVWAHGGGFALGSLDETDSFARALAVTSGCAIASVDYRLAPEHPFPAAIGDLTAVTLWVAERLEQLAGGAVPLMLAGDSAGANLATVVTRKLHEAGTLTIAANLLAYPATDNEEAASLAAFTPPFLGLEDVRYFFSLYAPDPNDRVHPDLAPIRAENLHLLPPTLVITAEHDILTGQAEDYARKLADAGVAVRISRHPGMIHGFVTMDFFFGGAAGTAMREMSEFVADVVAQESAEAGAR